MINGLTLGSIYSLVALGYSMVYGVLFFVNFAHGDVMMVGAFMSLLFLTRNLGFIPSLALAMACCAVLGMTIERIAYRPLRRSTRLAAMTSALGVSMTLQISAQLIWGTQTNRVPTAFPIAQIALGPNAQITTLQIAVLGISILMMMGLQTLIMKTKVGKALRATALDREAAGLMGINTNNIISFTFGIGSALAAVAGLLVGMAYDAVYVTMGYGVGTKAFTAAILGGIGSIPGAMVGGIALGVVEALGGAYLSSGYRDGIAFGVLILTLLFKPNGLFGKSS
ncbi:MAG: branched-chain amino acid ABC transporter permease [Ignavibacteriales bacterium]